MGKGYGQGQMTYEQWDATIKKCESEFKLMETALSDIALAREIQDLIYAHAKKRIKDFKKPEPKPEEVKAVAE